MNIRINNRPLLVLSLTLWLLWSYSGSVRADPHQTLKEITQKVVSTNPEVLAKWHAFRSASGEVDAARGGFFPKIDATTGAGRELLKQSSGEQRYTRSGYTLTLNQMIYDGFATANEVKRLDRARLTRYFELLEAVENAALEAGRAYFDVMRFRNMVFLVENSYVEHRAVYEQLLRRAQSGAGRRVDVEHAASRLALAEFNLNTEAANLHDVTSRYIRLVGESPPKVMFGPARLAASFPPSEADALRDAFKLNPTLRAAIENTQAAQHDLDGRNSAFQPKVDLRVRNENTKNYQGTPGTRVNNVAEVVLSYNFFNGGSDVARKRVYAERKYLALDLRDKACRDIRQTLSIAYNDVSRLKAQLSNLDLQVSSIEKTRDAYKAQFNIGQRSLLDLLDTENELLTARRTSINSDIDLSQAYLRTQAGIGRLLEFLSIKRSEQSEGGANANDDPDAREFSPVVAGEICPPDVPVGTLVDIKALTERALEQLDAAAPPALPAGATPNAAGAGGSAWVLPAPVAGAPTPIADIGTPSRVIPRDVPGSTVEKTIKERLDAWKAAWMAKDISAYLEFYAKSFVPADGVDRESWEKLRATRMEKPSAILIELNSLKVNELSADRVTAEFEQRYSSGAYLDNSLKTLHWLKVGDKWLIERETQRARGAK